MKETIVTLGKIRSLIGIVTRPEDEPGMDRPAVILLNSGILHRVGPSRLYVKIARELAAQGHVVLRFDFSGIGDSGASDEDLSFDERTASELDDAMNYLAAEYRSSEFVLIGICSGAKIAYRIQRDDARVVGAVPINIPKLLDSTEDRLASAVQNRSETGYLLRSSLVNPRSWRKLISGKADYRGILRKLGFLVGKIAPGAREEYADARRIKADIRAITDRGSRLLLIYSSTDMGLDYLREALGGELHALQDSGRFNVEQIRANHTFTLLGSQRKLIEVIADWLAASHYRSSGLVPLAKSAGQADEPGRSADAFVDASLARSAPPVAHRQRSETA